MTKLIDTLGSGQVVLMDGAMGSELYQAGLQPGKCGEAWNLTRPERVQAIHQSYVDAGAQCLLTNTFQANPCALVRHDRETDLERIVIAGVRLARAAAAADGLVLGDIGPILMAPTDQDFSDWDDLTRVVTAFTEPSARRSGVDGLLLETCSTPRALSAVEFIRHRVLEHDELPVLLSLAYRRRPDGTLTTHSGHPPETFARHAAHHGVSALGVNCGRDIDMDAVVAIVRRYRQATDLPLFVRPNAGTPALVDGQLVYPHSAANLAARLPELLEAGVAMVGGCCGTTPAHIAAFRPIIDRWNHHPSARD